MLGLMGEAPDTVVPSSISRLMETIRSTKQLSLWGAHDIAFNPDKAFSYRIRPMVEHPNGMRFQAFDQAGELLIAERYVSLGGGFIRSLDSIETDETVPTHDPMHPNFSTGQQLLDLFEQTRLSIPKLTLT